MNYADDLFVNIADDGMTNELWQLAKDDINILKDLKIKTEKDRNLYFYLENFIDELCEEFNCKIDNEEDIIKKAFNLLRNKKDIDLIDIRKETNRHDNIVLIVKNDYESDYIK